MNNFKNKKILTIDDEEALRRSFRIFFEDLGFIVFEAHNGKAGIECYLQEQPDIVLVDLRMPEMDGLQVINILAKKDPELPIIVVSGTGILQDAVEAIRAGAIDYITKPLTDMYVLEHVVNKALENSDLIKKNKMYQEHLEELVEKRTSQLRQAQKIEAIGTLAGGIAHDFNNILSGIIGYNELAMAISKNEQVIKYINESQKAADRAKNLVHQILTFSRKKEQSKTPLKVSLLVQEALKLLRSTIPSTIKIQQNIACDANVLADPSQIHQIIMNLCTNSFQAMEKDGGTMQIALTERVFKHENDLPGLTITPGNYIDFMVQDCGIGMDRETITRIFEPYFTTKEIEQGTGLGMAVVHGIVGSYNGQITVESELGKGTVFHVYLPIINKKAVHENPPINIDPFLNGTERIMFVDDETTLTNIAKLTFTDFGYKINTYNNSEDALAEFQTHPDNYDILITDMTMPNITGDILAKKILAIRPDLPIIICSGYSKNLTSEKVKQIGAKDLVSKPIVMSSLIKKIRVIFDK